MRDDNAEQSGRYAGAPDALRITTAEERIDPRTMPHAGAETATAELRYQQETRERRQEESARHEKFLNVPTV